MANDKELSTSRIIPFPRERVFKAWTDPNQLAEWWGPNGVDYPNQSRFVEIKEPERIVIHHESAPVFWLTGTFEDVRGKTKLTFSQAFETAEMRNQIAKLIGDANEQNLDRLEALLQKTQP